MNEAEFTAMVAAIRETEKAIGVVDYHLTDKQAKGKEFSRSLYVVADVKAGEPFTAENVRSIRPGFGLHPRYYHDVIGKTAIVDLQKGDRLSLEVVSD